MVFVDLDPSRILKDDFIIMLAHRKSLQKGMLMILEVKPQKTISRVISRQEVSV